jgi:hypothetical protein
MLVVTLTLPRFTQRPATASRHGQLLSMQRSLRSGLDAHVAEGGQAGVRSAVAALQVRASWARVRARWVTLRARWVDAESSLGDAKSSLGDAKSSLGGR